VVRVSEVINREAGCSPSFSSVAREVEDRLAASRPSKADNCRGLDSSFFALIVAAPTMGRRVVRSATAVGAPAACVVAEGRLTGTEGRGGIVSISSFNTKRSFSNSHSYFSQILSYTSGGECKVASEKSRLISCS